MTTSSKTDVKQKKREKGAPKPPEAVANRNNGSSGSQHDALYRLYASLLRCRTIQERVFPLGVSNRYELAAGREAVAVGATAELGRGDTVATPRRNLNALVACGVAAQTLLSEGRNVGPTKSAVRLALAADPFNLGAGLALAHKLRQKQRVVVAFCAQERPPLERWHDALKFAGVHKLPIIFVIENGIAAEASTAGEAPHLESVSFLARDYGFPGVLVDGKDAVAVWRVAQESIHRARNGSGPTLIDCRTDSERDPLQHMELYLRKRAAWNETLQQQVLAQVAEELTSMERKPTPQP